MLLLGRVARPYRVTLKIGVNLDPLHWSAQGTEMRDLAASLAADGMQWSRHALVAAQGPTPYEAWENALSTVGITPVAVLALESLLYPDLPIRERIMQSIAWWQPHMSTKTIWQLGNEQDAGPEAPSSWPMTSDDFSWMLKQGREQLGPNVYIIAGSSVTGNANHYRQCDLTPANGIDFHCYEMRTSPTYPAEGWGNGEMQYLYGEFAGFAQTVGKDLWCLEFGADRKRFSGGMSRPEYHSKGLSTLQDYGLTRCAPFCYDRMVDDYNLVEDGSWESVRRFAASIPVPPPTGGGSVSIEELAKKPQRDDPSKPYGIWKGPGIKGTKGAIRAAWADTPDWQALFEIGGEAVVIDSRGVYRPS